VADIGAISQGLGAVSRDGAVAGNHDTARAVGLSPIVLRRNAANDSTQLAQQAGFRDLRLATRTPVNLVLEACA
jgi:hypothetical protein